MPTLRAWWVEVESVAQLHQLPLLLVLLSLGLLLHAFLTLSPSIT
jgi:hypothetical protein